MKVGDLVGYDTEKMSYSKRTGIVVEVFIYQRTDLREGSLLAGRPMASVHWTGMDSPMMHRQDLLEVRSEGR